MDKSLWGKYLRCDKTLFCAGCGNGIFINRFLEAVEQLGLDFQKIIFVSGIGCAAWIPNPYFKAETIHTTHGRALAVATAIKTCKPNLKVAVVTGDGDSSTIGGNHLIHAARRNIPITYICINNFIYGMTGWQVGATTPAAAITTTTPAGNLEKPFDLVKLVLAAGAKFVSRWPLAFSKQTTEGLKRALEYGDKGFAFVEIVSPCPVQYGRRNTLASSTEMLNWQRKIYVPRGRKTKPNQIEFGQWQEDDLILRGGSCGKK